MAKRVDPLEQVIELQEGVFETCRYLTETKQSGRHSFAEYYKEYAGNTVFRKLRYSRKALRKILRAFCRFCVRFRR